MDDILFERAIILLWDYGFSFFEIAYLLNVPVSYVEDVVDLGL